MSMTMSDQLQTQTAAALPIFSLLVIYVPLCVYTVSLCYLQILYLCICLLVKFTCSPKPILSALSGSFMDMHVMPRRCSRE